MTLPVVVDPVESGDTGEEDADPMADLLALVTQQQQQIADLTAAVQTMVVVPDPEPTTPVVQEQPPEPPALGRGPAAQEYVSNLQQFASKQSQKVMAFTLARRYGIDIDALGFDHTSPEAMRIAAMELSQNKKLATLNQAFEDKLVAMQAAGAVVVEEPPVAPDGTGGPSSAEALGTDELTLQYEAIKQMGRTPEARRRLLELAYTDPSRRSVGP